MGIRFNEYDAEEFAHDALVAWKAKVLKRIEQIPEIDPRAPPVAFDPR